MKIGVDIGGSHIAVALIDEQYKIIRKEVKDIENNKSNMEEFVLDYINTYIEEFKKQYEITGIGISVPGNPKGTIVQNINNLGISYIDFKELANKHGIDIKVINDGKAAAKAEKTLGAMKNSKDCIFLCIGTGIGSAVYLNDQLLKCNKNTGFEIGHMIIDKNGNNCKCGKKGCFETYCSMRKFKEDIENVLNEKITNGIELKNVLEKNNQNANIKTVLNEYINNLIVGLSNLIDIFEPELICFGGSFVYFKEYLFEPLVSEMGKRKYVFNKQDELPKMVLSEFNNDSGLIGAVI